MFWFKEETLIYNADVCKYELCVSNGIIYLLNRIAGWDVDNSMEKIIAILYVLRDL